MTVAAGAQIGSYRILEQIGEGGMGSVWIAEHVTLGRRAAIKLLHPSFSSRTDIINRFFNEARAATAISDPGIVQIFDFGHDAGGNAYIVMELLEGEPLDRRLARVGRLQVHDALRIMRQVASSLGAAHARNIVHRDLKPENIYLVRDSEVVGGERAKLLDFGIAKLVGDTGHAAVKTQTSALMGTPLYMSPEQCRGAGKVDMRSDIYSLGCVMYTLLAGRSPFDAEGPGEIMMMHMTQTPPPVSSHAPYVTSAVDALVNRCLAKDPAGRFSHGTELAQAIDMLLSSIGNLPAPTGAINVQVAPPASTTLGGGAGETAGRAGRRSRGVLVGAGVIAIGAVVTAVVLRGGNSGDTIAPKPDPVVEVRASAPPAPAPAPSAPVPAPSAPVPAPSAPVPAPPAALAPPVKPSEPPPAPAVPARVSISIETTPPGARVFVGDDKAPRGMTPYVLVTDRVDLPITLRLVRPGYNPEKREVQLDADSKVAVVLVKAALAPSPASSGKPSPSVEDADDTMDPFHRKHK